MRTALAVFAAAGLASATLAFQPGQPDKPAQPANPQQPPAAPPQPPPPPPAKAIPVPEGEVVKRTELGDGLIIEDIKIGDGYEVKPGGAVVAHYHGTLKDGGKVFDSSFTRGEPAVFPLSGVIDGWKNGVPGMKVGGIRRLIVPSKLGYGERGAGADIPPNSDLVFIIQLVDALQVEDTKVGRRDAAAGACVAVTTFTMKDQDGKEVDKCDASKPYIWFPNEFQPIAYGLEGMKPGGKRHIVVPKEMNTPTPGAPPMSRPTNVPTIIDIELMAVRNLPGQRRR